MTVRLCASGSIECTGMLPCEACFEVVRERVLSAAIGYAGHVGMCDPTFSYEIQRPGGAFAHAFSDHGQALKAQWADHVATHQAVSAEAHPVYVEPPPAPVPPIEPPPPAPVQAGRTPCPAVLQGGAGGAYPCVKTFGHALAGDAVHVDATGFHEWRDDPTDEKLRRVVEAQQDVAAAEAQAADEAVRGVMPSEDSAKEYLKSIGYVDDGMGNMRPRRPHDPPPSDEARVDDKIPSAADPAVVENPASASNGVEQAPGA